MLLKAYVWWETLKARLRREDGQALTEYALIIALVALAIIVALGAFKNQIADLFNRMGNTLQNQNPG